MTTSGAGSSRAGFTLIEVLLSVSMLSVGAVLVLHALGRSASALTLAEQRRQACLFSVSKMAEVETALRHGAEQAEESHGRFHLEEHLFEWELLVQPEQQQEEEGKEQKESLRREVHLRVSWTQGRHRYEQRVDSLLAVPPPEDED